MEARAWLYGRLSFLETPVAKYSDCIILEKLKRKVSTTIYKLPDILNVSMFVRILHRLHLDILELWSFHISA